MKLRLGLASIFCAVVFSNANAEELGPASPFYHPSAITIGGLGHDLGLVPDGSNPDHDKPETGADFNLEVAFQPLSFDLARYLLNPKPFLGFAVNSDGMTNFVYGGLAIDHIFPLAERFGLFVGVGFGLAAHDGVLHTPRDANGFFYNDGRASLGTSILFRESVDVGFTFNGRHRLTAHLSHVSQGGFFDPANEGMDFVGMRYSFVPDGWNGVSRPGGMPRM